MNTKQKVIRDVNISLATTLLLLCLGIETEKQIWPYQKKEEKKKKRGEGKCFGVWRKVYWLWFGKGQSFCSLEPGLFIPLSLDSRKCMIPIWSFFPGWFLKLEPPFTSSIIHCPHWTIIGQSIRIVQGGHGPDNEKKTMKESLAQLNELLSTFSIWLFFFFFFDFFLFVGVAKKKGKKVDKHCESVHVVSTCMWPALWDCASSTTHIKPPNTKKNTHSSSLFSTFLFPVSRVYLSIDLTSSHPTRPTNLLDLFPFSLTISLSLISSHTDCKPTNVS